LTKFLTSTAFLVSTIFLAGTVMHGQVSCDSIKPDFIKQYENYSQKQFNKIKRKKDIDPETIFQIATYFRLKNDSTYKQWYQLTLDRAKSWYRDLHHDKQLRQCLLFHIGQSYYFLSDYQNANNYFQKAIKAQCQDSCVNYYYSQTKKKLGVEDK